MYFISGLIPNSQTKKDAPMLTNTTIVQNTRIANTAPKVIESYTNDEGEEMYILASGNPIPKAKYDANWNRDKTAILPKSFKGESPDKKQISRR